MPRNLTGPISIIVPRLRHSRRLRVRDRSPTEAADDGLGHFLRLLLPCCDNRPGIESRREPQKELGAGKGRKERRCQLASDRLCPNSGPKPPMEIHADSVPLHRWLSGRRHRSVGPGIPDRPNGLLVRAQMQRHPLPQDSLIKKRPVLGGLHHEYRVEKPVE